MSMGKSAKAMLRMRASVTTEPDMMTPELCALCTGPHRALIDTLTSPCPPIVQCKLSSQSSIRDVQLFATDIAFTIERHVYNRIRLLM
jgi:hypothetical protein